MPDIFFEKTQESGATTPDASADDANDVRERLDQTGLRAEYGLLSINGKPSVNNVPENEVENVRDKLEAAGFIVKEISYDPERNRGVVEML